MTDAFLTHRQLPKDVRSQPGLRVLYRDGRQLFGARGAQVVVSDDEGRNWTPVARLVLPASFAWTSQVRWLERLARTEIYKLQRCGDFLVAISRGGVYAGKLSSGRLNISYRVTRGSRPISLAVSPTLEAFFGEYHANSERGPIRIYGTRDFQHWRVAHEFPAGDVRHIHGITYDPHADCFWVTTGDSDQESGILRCSTDFSEVRWIRRGAQRYRACAIRCLPEGLLYATDTEVEKNSVYFLSRDGRELRELQGIESSSIHLGAFGEWTFFSTLCEPTAVNDGRQLHIWGTRDQQRLVKLAVFEKDDLPHVFQFGSASFPDGETAPSSQIIFSGTALKRFDNCSLFVPLQSFEKWAA
ncbi:MAG: hypothetical protein SH850_07405 [Planctomycetaceae bacterium]|nr:hypothetical protein [Planctomycetaceae bacterium]